MGLRRPGRHGVISLRIAATDRSGERLSGVDATCFGTVAGNDEDRVG
jgi:hypothetical protein